MSSLSTLPKGDSAWLLRKAVQRIMQQVSVLETNIGSSTTGNSANTQVIFNDAGTLRGDAGLTYNAATDTLTAGSATITGALTVTGAANLNGAVNLSTSGTPTVTLGSTATYGLLQAAGTNAASIYLNGAARTGFESKLQYGAAEHNWYNSSLSSLIATLNTTGLGVGVSPAAGIKLDVNGNVAIRDTFNLTMGFANQQRILAGGTSDNTFLTFSQWTGAAYTERMRIDQSGNVGIGVTPSAWFSSRRAVSFGGGSSLSGYIGSPGTELWTNTYLNAAGNAIYVYSNYEASRFYSAGGAFVWENAPNSGASGAGTTATLTPRMTLAATGNLLVGTTTDIAAVRMQVWSADSNNTAYFRNSNATTPYGPSVKYTAATPNNTSSEFLYCEDSTALRVALRSNGGIANYQANDVSLSDSRMKTDIKPLGSYWNKIKSLEVVTFKYNDQTHSDDNIGLIAQQVESVAPEFVDVDGFGETPVDGVPLKTIYTTDLYHAAIKALQEAMARIEALEAKLA